jgi:hypothetical protein
MSFAAGTWSADDFAAEVFRNDAMTIHAGLAGHSGQVVHLGDLLTLIVTVAYDPDAISVAELDAGLFTSAWPESEGIVLADVRLRRDSGPEPNSSLLQAQYSFQVLGCPDEQATCPGDTVYRMPEFVLEYVQQGSAAADAATSSVRFRPWPELLTVATTMTLDAEDQLYPFATYFPTGGYPDPQTGTDGARASITTAGVALAIFIGGLLMWPFRSKEQRKSATQTPRWQKLLQELRDDDGTNEGRFLDTLRRCLVWYCNDELAIDPFVWLDLAEPGDDDREDREHVELRALFVELLHNPTGRSAELRTRLHELIGQAGRA